MFSSRIGLFKLCFTLGALSALPALAGETQITAGVVWKNKVTSGIPLERYSYVGPSLHLAMSFNELWQGTASLNLKPKDSDNLIYRSFGLGAQAQKKWGSGNWFGSLGGELRGEQVSADYLLAGRSFHASTREIRPWVQAAFGYTGIVVPLPFLRSKTTPITKWIYARPLYYTGGTGDEGALKHAINASQASLQVGVRF